MPKNLNKKLPHTSQTEEAKQDALALAQLAYDIFKEAKRGATINNGQNNAKPTKRT